MLTGDSLLTALHTARECSIIEGRSGADESSFERSRNSNSSSDSNSNSSSDSNSSSSSSSSSSCSNSRVGGCSNDVSESRILILSISTRDRDKHDIISALKGQQMHVLPVVERLVWKDEEGREVFKYCLDAKKNYLSKKCTDDSTYSTSHDSEHLDDDFELVGVSARELSSLGGFELVTSGDAIALLSKGGLGSSKGDMDELSYFKVTKS